MYLYIVLGKKFSLENSTASFSKKFLPLESMIDEIRKSSQLVAFSKLEDAQSYRTILHNNHEKKIILDTTNSQEDYPIFTIEVSDNAIKESKPQNISDKLSGKNLSYHGITQDIIDKILAVDVGIFKNHQLIALSDLPPEILLKITNSNLSLTDIGNLMSSDKRLYQFFNSTKSSLVNKFWQNKQNLYQPFCANTENNLKTFRENYKKPAHRNHKFQWILNRAKEGDLEAFVNFNFTKDAEFIYTFDDSQGMTVLDWLKFNKHHHILHWLFVNKKLEPLFRRYYSFQSKKAKQLFSAICLNQDTVVAELISSERSLLEMPLISQFRDNLIKQAHASSVLELAIAFSSIDVVKILLNYVSNENKIALISSEKFFDNFSINSYEICQLLLEIYQGIKSNVPRMLPHYAARNKDIRVLKLVLNIARDQINDKASFPAIRNKLSFTYNLGNIFYTGTELTPLHIAACTENLPMMELLLNNGADINGMADGVTALHLAVELEKTDAVKFLLERQANPLLQSNPSFQPIHYAVKHRSATCLKILLDCYKKNNLIENLNMIDKSGKSLLHHANNVHVLQLLLHSGMNHDLLNIPNSDGLTPIHFSLGDDQKEKLAFFILNNSKLNIKSDQSKELEIYNSVLNILTIVQKQISPYQYDVFSYAVAGLRWYASQSVFTGYWFYDKDHVKRLLQDLEENGKTMTDEQLLDYLENNLKPSDPNNELSIIKILLTENIYKQLDRKNRLVFHKNEEKTASSPIPRQQENYEAMRKRMLLAAETRRSPENTKQDEYVEDTAGKVSHLEL